MTSQRIAELLKEMPLINDAYDRIRAEQVFAIDDIEYDMFSTGWKSAVDLATDNLTSHLAELQSTVAALELEVAKLRSVMTDIIKSHGYAGGTPVEVLSTPFTPTALNELIEKVEKIWREKCAEYCAKAGWKMDYDEIPEGIRAIPTGHIKLEELL